MSSRRVRRMIVVVLAAAVAPVSCSSPDLSGPPAIRLGRDECAECGMAICEERYSCALLVREQGTLEHRLFDDIGDMLDYERKHAGLEVKDRFVHDHESRSWRRASDSTFVQSDAIHTPMGSGLAAFADEAGARAKAPNGASVLTFSQVVEYRAASMKRRYGG